MNISKYLLCAIIGFTATNSNSMFFTQDQITHAEGKPLPSSPKKKAAPAKKATEQTISQPRKMLSYDPHSALFNPVPDYVQQAYANWENEVGVQNEPWQTSSKGKGLVDSQETPQ